MRVAVLISGRAARYEVCLYHILEKDKYKYDLFISVNDEPCKYYDIMRENLGKLLKGLEISQYKFPKGFKNTHKDSIKQYVNGKFVPQNVISMYYNDMNAFNMATKYADENGFEYDAYLKFRSDIIASDMPNIQKTDELKIYSAVPLCDFTCQTLDGIEVPIVCDAVAYGNRKSMKEYVDTYNFVLDMNEKMSGDYRIHFETCLTQSIYHKKVLVERFHYSYMLDGNRRIFDIFWEKSGTPECADSRINQIRGAHSPINSKDVDTTIHIPSFPVS